ncbi:hypothetical protein [Desertivirga brevis]|uniref:hypothetical protein n=1 Tax=Desertivirga brevis TaxID=2810310 RepID=UPI001A978A6C|nr:hypothetical protein [Pedobacter sp. SYSU D00873]
MKKLILGAVIGLISTASFAQKKFSEGTITYKVEWQPAPQMQQMAAMFPTELTVYFKGDSTATVSKSSFSNTNTILNPKTEYQRLLIDVPMRNKKYSVILTPDDVEQMKEFGPEFKVTPANETKTVNGFTAQKYTISEKKSGKSFDSWFTKDVDVSANSLTQFFDKTLGFPLEFQSFQSGMGVKATVKEIKEGKVPAGTFSATKDYEEITFAQLIAMMGGGRR